MLFHALSDADPGVNIEQVVATLREPLEEMHFLLAWQRTVERHPILRSRFRWKGVPRPLQEVVDQVEIPLDRLDWRPLGEAERRGRFDALMDKDRIRGFDLGQAPLMRLVFVRAGEDEYWVLWTFHHALLDGRSFPLVLREVFTFYDALSRGDDVDLPLPRPYRDHIDWLDTIDQDRAKPYWQEVLAGFLAPSSMVVARDRDAANGAGDIRGIQEIRLPAVFTTALRERAREASVTLNTLLQGAWALLLHRYSGESDIVFGATRACRKSSVGGAEGMIGLFINTLPIRISIDPEFELVPWLQGLRARQVALRHYEHSPLVKVQSWSDVPRGMPLFESLLVYENQTLDAQLRAQCGAWSKRRFQHRGQTNYPLVVIAYGDEELLLQLEYSRRRFDDDVIARMLGHLQTLLGGMAAYPKARLKDLPLLTEVERHQLLVEWNDTALAQPASRCMHELVAEQSARSPDAVAVVCDGRTVSYRELDRGANKLAHALRKRGVGPDVLVGLCVNRTPDMIIALLGVLKAGGAFVPLDPEYPADRLAFMLEDCGAKVLISEYSLRASLPPLPSACDVIYLDRNAEALAAEREDEPRSEVDLSNLAYVIYTSGSTGQPKAVLLTHRGLANLAVSEIRLYGIAPQSRVLHFASLSFDTSLSEIAIALCSGATLYVEDRDAILPGPDLESYLEREQITVLSLTPSALALLDPAAGPSLVQVIVGGEPCSAELAARWAGRCRFINAYGPTEATVTTTYIEYRDGALPPLIGRPLSNVRVYLVDPALEPVPVGVPGELYIGGVGVARGYLNRPQLNAERFLLDPFNDAPGALMYRTGDFGRWRPDGQIEFIGRKDDQVKIRGFRIELGEIEAALARHPQVQSCAVIAREDTPGARRLVAYLVLAKGEALPVGALRDYLMRSLPHYMVPAAFVAMEALPITPNDKVDRKALPNPLLSDHTLGASSYVAPRNDFELSLAMVWEKVLGVRRVGINDSFFELGGNSLSALQFILEFEDATGIEIDLGELFRSPTIAELAIPLGRDATKKVSIVVPLQSAGDGVPIFCLCGINLYKEFAESLGKAQPVFGVYIAEEQTLVNQVIKGHRPKVSTEQLTDAYCDAIARFRPHGPYRLAGLSFGGILAMEVASKLRRRSVEVDLVILLDTMLQQGVHRNWGKWVSRQMAKMMDRRAPMRSLRRLSAWLSGRLAERRVAGIRNRADSVHEVTTIKRLAFAQATNEWLASDQIFDFRVVLFRGSDRSSWGEQMEFDEDYGWRRYLGNQLVTINVAGNHLSILEPPNVSDLGWKAQQYLRPNPQEITDPLRSEIASSGG